MQSIKGFSLAVAVAVALSAWGAEGTNGLRGASAILAEVAAQQEKRADPDAALSPGAQLRLDLSNFTARASALAPSAAAEGWLALEARQAALPASGPRGLDVHGQGAASQPPVFRDLLAALPPPGAWDELASQLQGRPEPTGFKDLRGASLRMLGAALAGDREGLRGQVKALEQLLLKADWEKSLELVNEFQLFEKALAEMSGDAREQVAEFKRELDELDENNGGSGYVNVPNLAALLGEAEAAPLLERALKSRAQHLELQGKATEALARKIALDRIGDLTTPRWELVQSPDAVELYEALDKKFPKTSDADGEESAETLADLAKGRFDRSGSGRTMAESFYLMGLIARGRTTEAAELVRRQKPASGGGFQFAMTEPALAGAGFSRQIDDFLHEVLTRNPELPYWDAYFRAAARAGTVERMLELARQVAARTELPASSRNEVRENLYRALLAADRVDEGVQELRALLAAAPKTWTTSTAFWSGGIDTQRQRLQLARLGRLLDRPEWVEEGLAGIRNAHTDTPEGEYLRVIEGYRLAELLRQMGRWGEAEKLLAGKLSKSLADGKARTRFRDVSNPLTIDTLKALLKLYYQAGRHEDVLGLLGQSPDWGRKDLAEFVSPERAGFDFDDEGRNGPNGVRRNPVLQAAAAALLHAGRKAEARTIVEAMLAENGGDDRAYELLVQIDGQEAVAKLDALFARDRFEERPLIWKAHLLRLAGRHEESEKTARQAIAIDPSDGEQGKNDRMRVYAVLAEIRAARGDQKDAEFLRGAVRAIRLSERADDFFDVGLLSRAVKMYQDSLKEFTDAYCIQSRLAVQMSELGLTELAARHYEKAFELMPDSFGRVESHCFGCEKTFGNEPAQGIAERVFLNLVAKHPGKPQLHYLLGYLRKEQGRGEEAIPHFREAARLDPDYLNAWKHLAELHDEHPLPPAERDEIALNILRLDPLGRHAQADVQTVGDLRRLWAVAEVAAGFAVSPPATLLPLAASRAELERQGRSSRQEEMENQYRDYDFGPNLRGPEKPGKVLARHKLLAAIGILADTSGSLGLEK